MYGVKSQKQWDYRREIKEKIATWRISLYTLRRALWFNNCQENWTVENQECIKLGSDIYDTMLDANIENDNIIEV